jgi:hypothetical protein
MVIHVFLYWSIKYITRQYTNLKDRQGETKFHVFQGYFSVKANVFWLPILGHNNFRQ